MSNSSLVNVTVKSPNHSGARTHSIDRITPHCVVGQLTASGIGNCFPSGRGASCNYGIGSDLKVVLVVDECNRSWCSSSNENDQRAVTIECASDRSEPYAFTNGVYNKLIELCTDICRRNGKTVLLWFGDKNKSLNYKPKSNEMVLTVHRWFANKSCPGDWLYSRLGDVASKVTARLGGKPTSQPQPTPSTPKPSGNLKTGLYRIISEDGMNIRSGPGTNYGIVGTVNKGEAFTMTQFSGDWGKLKSGKGWINCNPKYCTFVLGGGQTTTKPQQSSGGVPFTIRVTEPTGLSIRKGPGTNYGKNGAIPCGPTKYTIVEVKGDWGKLKSGAGWICLTDYTERC